MATYQKLIIKVYFKNQTIDSHQFSISLLGDFLFLTMSNSSKITSSSVSGGM